jgi:diguanylate cyclase (GGDEF)-like protein
MAETPKRADRQEIARRVERGEKLLQKGKAAEALEEFLQTLALDPQNGTVRQMAADLCLSLQRLPEAVHLLGELFERQMEAGDAMRASLTYKKLARFANPTCEQKVRFGELLENSNRKLALETYEAALEDFSRQERKTDALAVLKRMVALDASERNMVRLGEVASEAQDSKQAAAAFLKLAQQAEASGANPNQWFERAYSEDSTDAAIALGYAKCLMQEQQVGAAIFVLDPLASSGNVTPEFRELYAKALLSANRLTEAAPLVWEIFEQNPSRIEQVRDLIGGFLDSQLDREAVMLAEKLEHFQRRKGERRTFLSMMQDIVAGHRPSAEMLEFLAAQFNTANREADYCATLLRLFDLYYQEKNYSKAGDALDRAAEIDAYEPGHQKRLEMLKGKIESSRYEVIASRFTGTAAPEPVRNRNEEKSLGSGTLQDLMLQAEILVQYGMRNKALERLQRIQQLFPHEEDRNPELHQLYLAAGMTPQYAGGNSGAAAPASASVSIMPTQTLPSAPLASDLADMSGFARVSDITRKLNQQNTAEAVLNITASEIGSQWQLGRCIAALRKPGVSTSTIKEFISSGSAAPSDVAQPIVRGLHEMAVARGALIYSDISAEADLETLRPQLSSLGVRSLLVIPLMDGSDHVGVLLLMQNTPRNWSQNDVLVFKIIAEQVAIALNNVGLRRLVNNLSVTDENSGLLKRASYLDLLMGEIRRAAQQNSPVSVLLMRFWDRAALTKEQGEAAVDNTMRRLGQLVAGNIRQNDLAFRYAANAIALVLAETAENEALLVVEKMRRLITAALGDKQMASSFNAGVAEAVIRKQFDAVDVVTEVINRAERALEKSVVDGPGKSVALPPAMAAAAVA